MRLSRHGPGHESPMTIPEFFRESVNRFGTYPALASKKDGKWDVLNYNQYYEACRKTARAMLKLGLEPFHSVGILGFNSIEWILAALGATFAGGFCVGIYATNSADACEYVITHAKVNILLVENGAQLQKILSWDDFLELGSSIPDAQLDQIIKSQKANQCAVIIYTSGTTGQPKGVMLSHD
ncbi:hypothetical protein Celaphus_00003278, partial [Cervus elaphus hippelaphus]